MGAGARARGVDPPELVDRLLPPPSKEVGTTVNPSGDGCNVLSEAVFVVLLVVVDGGKRYSEGDEDSDAENPLDIGLAVAGMLAVAGKDVATSGDENTFVGIEMGVS
jgi:hypothetical protein